MRQQQPFPLPCCRRVLNGFPLLSSFCCECRWSWEVIPSSTAPPAPRFNHASCVVDGKIVIHGGWDERSLFSDLWVFDLGTVSVASLLLASSSLTFCIPYSDSSSWVQPRIGGPAPAARHGHSLSLSPDGRLLVFGGYDDADDHGHT